MKKTKELVLAGLLIAGGLIVPTIFHAFNLGGKVFLPMHIPVFLAGMLLSPPIAMLTGILIPVTSTLITSMPPIYPMMVIMAFELGAYGLATSLSRTKLKLGYLGSYLVGLLSGRVISALVVAVLASGFGVEMSPISFFRAGFVTGLPGIIIQIFLIPVLARVINKYLLVGEKPL